MGRNGQKLNQRPHVLIVDNSLATTGALKSILLYTEYAKSQFRFSFLLPKGSDAVGNVSDLGYKVYELPFVEINKKIKSLLCYVPMLIANAIRLSRIVRTENIHLVHTNDFYNLVPIATKLLGSKSVLITHVRFMPDRFPKPLVRLWTSLHLKYSSQIICVSRAVKDCLPASKKVQVIYNSIDRALVPHRKQLNKKNDTIELLYVAHYIPGKGQNFALEAFSSAFKKEPSLRLTFVGGDMGLEKNRIYREQLRQRSHDLGIDHVIRFEGACKNIEEKYRSADIAINFSESESFSRTCLEALLLGVPLIASDCGGPAELFEDGKSGYLVSNKKVSAMTDAIVMLATDQSLQKKYSKNGIDYVGKKFAKQKTIDALQALYTRILAV